MCLVFGCSSKALINKIPNNRTESFGLKSGSDDVFALPPLRLCDPTFLTFIDLKAPCDTHYTYYSVQALLLRIFN